MIILTCEQIEEIKNKYTNIIGDYDSHMEDVIYEDDAINFARDIEKAVIEAIINDLSNKIKTTTT